MKQIVFFILLLFCGNIIPQELKTKDKDSVYSIINEVVVTGTRTSKKIIDIPFSVNYLNMNEVKFNKSLSVTDVLQDIPGVNLQSRYGNHDVKISIRGFGSRSSSGIRGVRILLDGIPESEPDGQTRIEAVDFDAVGRIEVVKGNSSSLYTNAPGGVINFINTVDIPGSYVKIFNHIGSFDLLRSGIKLGLKSSNYTFQTTYSYHNYKGYRNHSQDYWNILNSTLQVTPNDNSKLNVMLYYADGVIKLPGSLTLAEFNTNSDQAAKKEDENDYRRKTQKGRLGIGYNGFLDKDKQNEIEIIGYGTIKLFDRVDTRFRIMNRWGVGGSYKFVNRSVIFDRKNEFVLGGDLFYQSGPVEVFEVLYGNKTDKQKGTTDETISNVGFFFQNSYDLINEKLSALITGRFEKVKFSSRDKLNESVSDEKTFQAFTPKVALNFKLNSNVAIFSSFGYSFDCPASNELNNFPLSSNFGAKLLNPDLKPQKATNFEFGIKGSVPLRSSIIDGLSFDATTFYYNISDEIVPFEINGSYFYRNSAKTDRFGIELGSDLKLINYIRWKISYTFSNFKYNKYDALIIGKSYDSVTMNYSNNIVPSVPKHYLFTSLAFEKKLLKELTVFSKVNLSYTSDMFVDDANSEKTESYSLLDMNFGLEYSVSNFIFSLSGGINNILNKKYVSFININSLTKQFYESGMPRNYFSNLSVQYNL